MFFSLLLSGFLVSSMYSNGDTIKMYDDVGNCPRGAVVTLVTRTGTVVNAGCWAYNYDQSLVIIHWDNATEVEYYPAHKVQVIDYA